MGFEQDNRFTKEEIEEFESLAKPLCDWIKTHGHPHMLAIALPTFAQIVEGVIGFDTETGDVQ